MEEVRVPASGGRTMRAALALPPGPGPHPGVVVIHEIFGLNDDIRGKAERLASMGYAALAPDLYDGRGPKPICVFRAVQDLRHGSGPAFEDLEAAHTWLAARPEVDGSRIGAIGFCLGGAFALLFAVRAPLGATAVLYGEVPRKREQLEGVCPVVASYGARDGTMRGRGERLERLLTALDVPHDVKTYPGAGHSFMSDHQGAMAKLAAWGPMKIGFRPEDAEDSWARVAAFFGEHLRSEE